MKKQSKYGSLISAMQKVINISFLSGIYCIMWNISYADTLATPMYYKGIALLVLVYAITYGVISSIYGGHKIGYLRITEVIYSQFLSVLMVNAISFLQICLVARKVVRPLPLLWLSILDFIFIVVFALMANKYYYKKNPAKRMTAIYGGDVQAEIASKIKQYDDKFNIYNTLSENVGLKEIFEKIKNDDAIVIDNVNLMTRNEIIKFCFEENIPVYMVPKITDIIIKGSDKIHLWDTPLFLCKSGELTLAQRCAKRCVDLFLSILILILTFPITVITAIVIKAYDGGPVLFKQKRLTRGGKVFEVYKFRSMVIEAEKDGVARLAVKNDSRITPIGKFIRRVRIDEIPQLFNIVRGDMSVVGPRPERPEIAKEYSNEMPEFNYRLKVKAGLTGYAQVLGKYNTAPYDKMKLDMMYIEEFSFFSDLKLILMTIKILFMPDSTEGVDQECITASNNLKETKNEKITTATTTNAGNDISIL